MYDLVMIFILLMLCIVLGYCFLSTQDELEREHRRAERYKRVLTEVSKDAAKGRE